MAVYPGFIAASNQLQSPRADCSRLINLYLENSDVQTGRPALYGIPGQRSFLTVATDSDVRALYAMNDRVLSVVGSTVVELFAGATSMTLGTVTKNANPAQIVFAAQGIQRALIASGNNAYELNLSTNVLSAPVLTGEARQIGVLNGIALALDPSTGRLQLSAQDDFTTWPDAAVRSVAPDTWQAVHVKTPDIWLIGSQSGDVWYDTGESFPFAQRPGATFPYGIAAPFSICSVGDSVLWLARNAETAATVVQARGYVPKVIASYAIETALTGYLQTSRVDDAEALGCEINGHLFYVLSFPSANVTWAYDLRTGLWSEWGQWNSPLNRFDRWLPRVTCQAFQRTLIGGSGSGAIAAFDDRTITELDGGELRRVRIPPAIQAAEHRRLVVDRFELGVDSGVGTTIGQGSAPRVLLRTSGDFGKTWSNERYAELGAIGNYEQEVVWNRCGSFLRSFTPELVITDPVALKMTGASIIGTGFGQGF